jgi:hypothetical protein
MKRKDFSEVVNKIVNVEQVVSRGQRIPSIELVFKPSGYNRTGGHKVYIDYKCAEELLKKLKVETTSIQSKYFPHEYYDRLTKPLETLFSYRA